MEFFLNTHVKNPFAVKDSSPLSLKCDPLLIKLQNFVLAEDGYSNRKYDRDTEHHGQGVSTNAGKPVSWPVASKPSIFFQPKYLFQAVDSAVPEGGDPTVCVEGDGGVGNSV